MKVALITSCTSRKRLMPLPLLRARRLARAPLADLAAEWVRRVESAPSHTPAREFYAGRSFTEALAAANRCQGTLHIVSAGVGLIHVDDGVPPYSLTTTGRTSDNVLTRVDGEGQPAQWWTALNRKLHQRDPLSRLITSPAADLYVLALPATYVDMVSEDLASLSAQVASSVRVIGLPSLAANLPPVLASALVPYDERLQNPRSGHAGTRADFAQRAARHFVTAILARGPHRSAIQHAADVEQFLSGFSRPQIPQRERIPDERVKEVIRDMWKASGGRAGHSLRMLRRERRLSCEQSRFKRLFWEVAAEKGVSV
jgi:hypothetical protein